jgi:hypothetical protein
MKFRVDFTARTFDWYLERLDLDGARVRGDRDLVVRCPAHDDYNPSLHIVEDEDGLLVHCFAGCSWAEIDEALSDTASRPKPKLPLPTSRRERGTVVATYDYRNAVGELIFRKLRLDPKSFEIRRPVVVPAKTSGPIQHSEYVRWAPGLKDRAGNYLVDPVPYNLPELIEAVEAGAQVWVVDGEKDADRLNALQPQYQLATCSPFGMARWKPEWNEYLRDADVVIVADRDEAGYQAAAKLGLSLVDAVLALRTVEAVEGKDAYDHLEAGLSVDAFVDICHVC